jgi:O-antigen/teichoic acid export membrane protein
MIKNRQVFSNTLFLYFRQVLIILVSLYTIRVVLDVLGVEDYGIYALIASIVSLGVFINGTMASATQRYFSFAIGKQEEKLLATTFSVNFVVYAIIALLALVVLETLGLWLVQNYVSLPTERYGAAMVLYHWSAMTFVITLLIVPLASIIISHEDMKQYALFAIVEALLKLAVVFALKLFEYDKLELYGVLLFIVSVLTFVMHLVFCLSKYQECQFRHIYWDRQLVVHIFRFTGWTFFGQMSTVARNQAITILLNQFFSPATVAARAISTNIAMQTNVFASKFNTGLYPPIIKSYANEDKTELFNLLYFGSKFTFFLMWLFTLPLIIELETVLNIWLVDVPQETYLFTRLALIEALLLSVSLPIATAARAPGDMKQYELSLGGIQFLIMLFSYLFLKFGFASQSVYWIAIVANVVMFWVRLSIVSKLVGLDVREFTHKVIHPLFIIIALSATVSYSAHELIRFESGILSAVVRVAISMAVSTGAMFMIGIEKPWRDKIIVVVRNKLMAY